MIDSFKLGTALGDQQLGRLLDRFETGDDSCRDSVAEILESVRDSKNEALIKYTNKFDSPHMGLDQLQADSNELLSAYDKIDKSFLESLSLAIDRIQSFHEREMEDSWIQTREDGTIVGRLVRPVDSAGLYVPGGQGGSTPLVSSVLMNGIPAGIAGVAQRLMVTPPSEDGSVDPHLLVAAQEIGITEIFKVGSAWAIGALAYGTETIPPVDVIVGPGNQYVTEAKRQVSGRVRIDMIAGPSEVLIIADQSAEPASIAADMLAQAEHDPLALAIVITTHEPLVEQIIHELDRQLPQLKREDIARKSLLEKGVIFTAESIDDAVDAANAIAIEHLELLVEEPWSLIPHIRHAGAIFLGANTPEAAGDYIAGPNHVLPTMGTARYASALGVETFLKKSSLISCSGSGFRDDAEHIMRLARLEGLDGHANSVAVRLKK